MATLLQRLCWNSNNWNGPTGELYKKEDSFVGESGFGFEDWNFNTGDLLDGHVFGYTYYNPHTSSPLCGQEHDIYFFSKDLQRNSKLVGVYKQARFLSKQERTDLKHTFEESDIIDKRIEELLSLNLPEIRTIVHAKEKLLQGGFPNNIYVRPENVFSFQDLPELTTSMTGGKDPKNLNRYTRPTFLKEAPIVTSTNLRGNTQGSNLQLIEDSYLRFTGQQQKVIARLHNRLSNRFRVWLEKTGATNILAEVDRVDVQCMFRNDTYLFELKTCFQQSTKHAMREAIGQILEYSHFPGRKKPKFAAVVLDVEPSPDEIAWCKALNVAGLPFDLYWLKGEIIYSAKISANHISTSATSSMT